MAFVKMERSAEVDEMLKHPLEFTLLAQIAKRARRAEDDANIHGLEIGQALVGDYQSVGMSRQQYRRCLTNLQTWQIITIKPTNKGTIAKIINTRIFDPNLPSNQPTNTHATNQQTRTQPTTKKNIRRKEDQEDYIQSPESGRLDAKQIDDIYFRAADYAIEQIKKTHPHLSLNGRIRIKTAADFDKLVRIDKKALEDLRAILDWLPDSPIDERTGFSWKQQIQSPLKIRQRKDGILYFDKLFSAMNNSGKKESVYV